MNFTLKVWRQANSASAGRLETYAARDVPSDASFLEMIDIVNMNLEEEGKEPIAFAHDCREGICGSCSMMIDGVAHGPVKGAATCQVHMRTFQDGQEITVEPWRSVAFPVLKDLGGLSHTFSKLSPDDPVCDLVVVDNLLKLSDRERKQLRLIAKSAGVFRGLDMWTLLLKITTSDQEAISSYLLSLIRP